MKIITINLSEKYLAAIQVLTDEGIYPSRSQAIRVALKDFLENELNLYEDLDSDNFREIVKNVGKQNWVLNVISVEANFTQREV